MKLTRDKLKQIIKEELEEMMQLQERITPERGQELLQKLQNGDLSSLGEDVAVIIKNAIRDLGAIGQKELADQIRQQAVALKIPGVYSTSAAELRRSVNNPNVKPGGSWADMSKRT